MTRSLFDQGNRSPLPEFEDEATLYSLASEFLAAASVLASISPTGIKYTLVTYYLAGHAAELMLKSFLFKRGDTIETLTKRYKHDLKLLVKRSRLKGLQSSVSTQQIESFGNAYARKRTEYRRKCPLVFPPLDLLLAEISTLQTQIFSFVAEFESGLNPSMLNDN